MNYNTFGFDFGDEDERDPLERSFFELSDTVGRNGKNLPQDVIKTEIILGNTGDLDLDRTDGPTSIWGQTQEDALRKYQKRNYLTIDGYMKPRGPTINLMEKQTDRLLSGFNAPTPEEIIKHHATLGSGEPILSLKHPAIKMKPIADLPALEDGAAFHTQRSADYLANIYDLGDWPRWTAKEIEGGGASAIANTRDVLDRLKQANPDQAAKVARAVIDHLPDSLKTAFVGGPIPPALPRWVRSKEVMNRIVRLQAQRDHGFDTGEDAEPKSMAEMEQQKPKDYLDIRTEEDAGQPIGLARPSDDPEDEERRLRNERLDRRRAERAKENLNLSADAGADTGGEADPPKDGGQDAGKDLDKPAGPWDRKSEPADGYQRRDEQSGRAQAKPSGLDPLDGLGKYQEILGGGQAIPRKGVQYAFQQDGTMTDAGGGGGNAPSASQSPGNGGAGRGSGSQGNSSAQPGEKEKNDQAKPSPVGEDRAYIHPDIEAFTKENLGKIAKSENGLLREDRPARECVALVVKAVPEIGTTDKWRAGEPLKKIDDPPLKPGTAIATFGKNGTYASADRGNHAALFMGYEEHKVLGKGMWVVDQWAERDADPAQGRPERNPKPVGPRFIPFNGKGGVNDAFSYSVISKGGRK